MKVLVGRFSSESNEHSRSLMSLDKFILKYGEDCIDSMYCRDIFEKNGIELIPSIGAIGHPPSYGSTRKFIGRISFKCKSIKML